MRGDFVNGLLYRPVLVRLKSSTGAAIYAPTPPAGRGGGGRHLIAEWGNTPRGAAFFAMIAAAEATERAQAPRPINGDCLFARVAFKAPRVRVWHGRHAAAPETPPCLEETPLCFDEGRR